MQSCALKWFYFFRAGIGGGVDGGGKSCNITKIKITLTRKMTLD